ncbi:MBL fold metallo-hydrolase [Patescibacteria group bacterium]|nr:MBL fold metallo-hydrolase [Patescibacteria group bacterium]
MKYSKNKVVFIFVSSLFLLNIFAWQIVWDLSQSRDLMVDFLNIGQGDSIFIETPWNQQILIDGGPDSKILEKLGKEMPFYDKTIDLIILTHPEKDHLAGLLEVLKRYKVKNILWTGVVRDTVEWQEWVNLIKKEKAEIKIAKIGARIIFKKENPQIFIDILNPVDSLNGKELKDSNDSSIVAYLTIGKNSFLFTGDIGFAVEKQLAKEDINADVLKIAHHGSKYSSSEDFLKAVLPKFAIIEVGENNYGHPTNEVLARLSNFGIETLRTDKDGDIKVFSDGESVSIKK